MNQFNGPEARYRNAAHYHAGIVNQIEDGSDRDNIGKLYQISFDNKVPFSDDLISTSMMMDVKTHQIDESEKDFKKVRVNLSKIRKMQHNNVNELTMMKRILLVMIENKKEILHKLSKGDKELEIMAEGLENLSKDPDIVSYYNEQKLNESARKMYLEAARKEATESGRASEYEEGHNLIRV